MTTAQLSTLIGRKITVGNPRTGTTSKETIADAKTTFGVLRIKLVGSDVWFEPTKGELQCEKA